MASLSTTFVGGAAFSLIFPEPSVAGDLDTAASELVQGGVEMKMFVDPQGLFALNLPKRFFALRRTAKGDLPDEKTGSGRRGSSIFNAGDLAKAEVLAVERYVRVRWDGRQTPTTLYYSIRSMTQIPRVAVTLPCIASNSCILRMIDLANTCFCALR